MKKATRRYAWTMLLLLFPFAGCKLSGDAVQVSEQMSVTATALERYYGALAEAEGETISLLEVDGALNKLPFDDKQRQVPEETRQALVKRKEMAGALAELAAAMTRLTGSKAPADIETAASALGTALVDAKAIPDSAPVPESLGKAGKVLLTLVQQHEAKKAAQAMDQTLAAMAELFEKEQPAYDSAARGHLKQAAAVARDLTANNEVDVTPMLLPALKPFGLVPLQASPGLQGSLKELSQQRLDRRVDEGVSREMDASKAMLAALKEMSARVHALASGQHIAVSGKPFSLVVVERWLDAVS